MKLLDMNNEFYILTTIKIIIGTEWNVFHCKRRNSYLPSPNCYDSLNCLVNKLYLRSLKRENSGSRGRKYVRPFRNNSMLSFDSLFSRLSRNSVISVEKISILHRLVQKLLLQDSYPTLAYKE